MKRSRDSAPARGRATTNAPASVAYGVHAVRLLLERSPERVLRLWIQGGKAGERLEELRRLAQGHSIEASVADAGTLDRLSANGRHQGIVGELVARSSDPETELELALEQASDVPLLLVLDGVQDPHNLGACLRTADAAQATAVLAPRDRASGLTPVVRKVAAGAADAVPFVAVVNLARTLRELKERGIWLVGLSDQAAQSLYDADLTGPTAIVMGGEAEGLRRLTRETCDALVSIPMAGVVESLNVSVAAGVALYEAIRQRRALAAKLGTAPATPVPAGPR
jgi:23S rRNA (guanosine2251-2'-O)-methyltransferase